MALQLVCDGCRTPLYTKDDPKPAQAQAAMIEGRRANGMRGGSPVPEGDFHLCERCAKIAFTAVRDAAPRLREGYDY